MLYEVNNKAQAVGTADYSVFETSYDENVEFNANTVGDASASHAMTTGYGCFICKHFIINITFCTLLPSPTYL